MQRIRDIKRFRYWTIWWGNQKNNDNDIDSFEGHKDTTDRWKTVEM